MKYLVDILVPEAMPGFWGDVVFIRLYQFFVVGNVVTENIVEIMGCSKWDQALHCHFHGTDIYSTGFYGIQIVVVP